MATVQPSESPSRIASPKLLITTLTAVLTIISGAQLWAQSSTVLHAFSGSDGIEPWAGVTLDSAGNLYGTTALGGATNPNCPGEGSDSGCGTVYKLTHRGSAWTLAQLYNFHGGSDSAYPTSSVVFGPGGALYGTTQGAPPSINGAPTCSQNGCGSVFRLTPPATVCKSVSCPWTKTTVYSFRGGVDGSLPGLGSVVFDAVGNLYGTTQTGGAYGAGTVYEIAAAGGGWTETVLYSFSGHDDGGTPVGGVVFDSSGNLYGTTASGGSFGWGTVFKLSPSATGWTETVLHTFVNTSNGSNPDGGSPQASLVFHNNLLYGTTAYGPGNDYLGTVFVVNPAEQGGYFATVNGFLYLGGVQAPGPLGPVTLDAAGNVYGSQYESGSGSGGIYEIVWAPPTFPILGLLNFNGDNGDGPVGNVVFDAHGNLYGTASAVGPNYGGVVWELTP